MRVVQRTKKEGGGEHSISTGEKGFREFGGSRGLGKKQKKKKNIGTARGNHVHTIARGVVPLENVLKARGSRDKSEKLKKKLGERST